MNYQIGNKYNTWTIISIPYKNKWNKNSVDCQCDCGTIKIIELSKLNTLTCCRKCYSEKIKKSPEEKRKYKANYFQKNKIKIIEKRKNNPPIPFKTVKGYQLKYLYNTSQDEIDALYIVQKGCCFICNKPFDKGGLRMVIDHNHKTNKIRGLLCHNCNTGLGHFKDNIETLLNAIKYLEYEQKISNDTKNK